MSTHIHTHTHTERERERERERDLNINKAGLLHELLHLGAEKRAKGAHELAGGVRLFFAMYVEGIEVDQLSQWRVCANWLENTFCI